MKILKKLYRTLQVVSTLCFLPFSIYAENNQIFTVKSLNHSGDSLVTLTINIGVNGAVTVSKLVSIAAPGDVTSVGIVGNDVWFSGGGGPDSSIIEIEDQIPNQQIFWVDIELDSLPSVPAGGNKITFYCLSYNCPTEERCKPTTVISNNQANVECTKPCQRCELKYSVTNGTINSLGGVFICGTSVSYN
jgi:hypothetical protein